MLIAKLTVSYDRGAKRNRAEDLGLADEPDTTAAGKLIRGLGTHWESEEQREEVRQRDRENVRIRRAFRERFLVTPLDGVYVVPKPGEAEAFVRGLGIRADVSARVTEFRLESVGGGLGDAEMSEWSERIKRQLQGVQLGRSKEADEDGLRALEVLARCPVLSAETSARILDMVGSVRIGKLDKVELRRNLEVLEVGVAGGVLSPRRAPVAGGVA